MDIASRVLVIDDEKIVRELLEIYLTDMGIEPLFAVNGKQGWEILKENYKDIDLILLDKMMPDMDGLELMRKIKEHPVFFSIPVIMQSAACSKEDMEQGIAAGVFHYLMKPYDDVTLQLLVRQALGRYKEAAKLRHKLSAHEGINKYINECSLVFKTLEDARQICVFLASFYPSPDLIVVGISELLINAVEHGNLDITFNEKTELHKQDRWAEEVSRRLSLPSYKDKKAYVHFRKTDSEICLTIRDEGAGFDWRRYLDLNPELLMLSHGRGISMCKHMFFDDLIYNEKGNEVEAVMKLNQ